MTQPLEETLPLPLARAYANFRRSSEVKETHDRAFAVFEVTLKYLASLFITDYVHGRDRDHRVNVALKGLVHPSLGEWAGFLRELVRFHETKTGQRIRSLEVLTELLSSRQGRPELLGFQVALVELIQKKTSNPSVIQVLQIFDLLVRYRNWGLGHGAPLALEAYRSLVSTFSEALPALLEHLEELTRMDLVLVEEVHSGEKVLLSARGTGSPRERDGLEESQDRLAALIPGRLYLRSRGHFLPLHPMVIYLNDDVYFLNSGIKRKSQRVEYLSYSSGDHQVTSELERDQRQLLGRILGYDVNEQEFTQMVTALGHGAPRAAETQADLRSLGDYTIIRELGRGGMGVVYEAFQRTLGRQVALKVLGATTDPRAIERFHRECRAVAKLHHPNIIPVYEVGESEGIQYFSMALIAGPSLGDVILEERRRGDPTLPHTRHGTEDGEALDVPTWVGRIRDVARALDYAHGLGMIHRDVKPPNMILDPSGRLILLDFGLVRDEVEQTITQSNERLGTLRYMSPEQILRRRVDCRTDVWSLGATLYELITLRPAFAGQSEFEIEKSITAEDPPPLRRLVRKLNPDLETIIGKALEKNPDRRYPTAAELADDLERFLQYRPIHARPPGPARRAGRLVQRHRMASASVVAALLALVAVLGVGMYRSWERRRNLVDAADGRVKAGDLEGARSALAVLEEEYPDDPRLEQIADGMTRLEFVKKRDESLGWIERANVPRQRYATLQRRSAEVASQWKLEIKRIEETERTPFLPVWERPREIELWRDLRATEQSLSDLYNEITKDYYRAIEIAPAGSLEHERAREELADFLHDHLEKARIDGYVPFREGYFAEVIRSLGVERYREKLDGHNRVTLTTEPPGAEVYCFRYRNVEERLVPVPHDPRTGRTGDPALVVARVWNGDGVPFRAGDRFQAVASEGEWRKVTTRTELAAALSDVGVDEAVSVRVIDGQGEREESWIPFPARRYEGGTLSRLAFDLAGREDVSLKPGASVEAGRIISIVDQFGFTFAGYPLSLDEGFRLGTTGSGGGGLRVDLENGSYLFVFHREGFLDTRHPVALPGELDDTPVRLLPEGALPPGYVHVPAGTFAYGGDRGEGVDQSLEYGTKYLRDFGIGKTEISIAECIEFANDLSRRTIALDGEGEVPVLDREGMALPLTETGRRVLDSLEAGSRYQLVPRGGPKQLYWEWSEERGWVSKIDARIAMLQVSWILGHEYASWLTERHHGRWTFRLPTDLEWEKAARGVDRRFFVWGDYLIWSRCRSNKATIRATNTLDHLPGLRPLDESVYGVLDMAGSMKESVEDITEGSFRALRGGSWYNTNSAFFRICQRNGYLPHRSFIDHGLRLVVDIPLREAP